MAEFWSLTFTPLITALLAAWASALLGNLLVLRRQAMQADAVSHAVFPGLVVAFLLSGSMSTLPMLLGAFASAFATLVLIEVLRRGLRLDPGAAIGISFTVMFALGVVMLEQSGASRVHLDVEHALMGNLESLIWLAASGHGALVDAKALASLPPALPRLALVLALVIGVGLLLWRPLVISTFDPVYAEVRGLPVRLASLAMAALTAMVAVASFEAVGAILVVAMVICPAAAARLLADSLPRQIILSLAFASLATSMGVLGAAYLPPMLGANFGISAAGATASLAGLILAVAAVLTAKSARPRAE